MKKRAFLLMFFVFLESLASADEISKAFLDAILECSSSKTQQLLEEHPHFDLSQETQMVMTRGDFNQVFRSMSLLSAATACPDVNLFAQLRSHARKNGKSINAFINRWNESVLFWAIVFWNKPVIDQILDSEDDLVDVSPVALSETLGQSISLHDVISIGDDYINFEFPNGRTFETHPKKRDDKEKRIVQQKLLDRGAPKAEEVYFIARGTRKILATSNLFKLEVFYHRYLGKGKYYLPEDSPYTVYRFSKESHNGFIPGSICQVLTRSGVKNFAIAGEDNESFYLLTKSLGGEDLDPLTLGGEVIQFDESQSRYLMKDGSVAITMGGRQFNTRNLEGDLPILILSQGVAGGTAGHLIESLLRKHPDWANRIRLIQASPLSSIPDWDSQYKRWIQLGVKIVVAIGKSEDSSKLPKSVLPEGVRVFAGRIQELISGIARENLSFLDGQSGQVPHIFAVGSNEFIASVRSILLDIRMAMGLKGPLDIRTNTR